MQTAELHAFRKCNYPRTLHWAQNAVDLVKCCTNEILCAHRLQKIRGNIGWSALLNTFKTFINNALVAIGPRQTGKPTNQTGKPNQPRIFTISYQGLLLWNKLHSTLCQINQLHKVKSTLLKLIKIMTNGNINIL